MGQPASEEEEAQTTRQRNTRLRTGRGVVALLQHGKVVMHAVADARQLLGIHVRAGLRQNRMGVEGRRGR